MAMQKIIETEILNETISSIRKASTLLSQNELVAFPTETVYGLGASAVSNIGVAKIFAAKGRPIYNPLIIHVADEQEVFKLAVVTKEAETLIKNFWPGPLTLVLEQKRNNPILSPLITGNLETIAIRIPMHGTAQKLMREFGSPIAAPSANISGRISPTRAKDVLSHLNGKIAALIQGDNCVVGLESTILNLSTGEPTLLRPGGIPTEEIEAKLGRALLKPMESPSSKSKIIAPGMMNSHYAPRCKLNLNKKIPGPNELFLAFGDMPKRCIGLNLSQNGDLGEAAANFFAALTDIDEMAKLMKINTVSVAPIPNFGLGIAINDRLKRAATPKN